MTQGDRETRIAVFTMPIFGLVLGGVVLGGFGWEFGGKWLGSAGLLVGAVLGLFAGLGAAWNSRQLLEAPAARGSDRDWSQVVWEKRPGAGDS